MYLPISKRFVMGLIITVIASLSLIFYSMFLLNSISFFISFLNISKWLALTICFILFFIGLFAFFFFIMISSNLLVNFYYYRLEKNKRKRDISYELYLLEKSDPNLIFDYFNKIKTRLPDNLHNIMLGYALSKNYNALSYISSIDTKTGQIRSSVFKDQIIFEKPFETCLSR